MEEISSRADCISVASASKLMLSVSAPSKDRAKVPPLASHRTVYEWLCQKKASSEDRRGKRLSAEMKGTYWGAPIIDRGADVKYCSHTVGFKGLTNDK